MTKIVRVAVVLITLLIVGFYVPGKVHACYIYFKPARPAYQSNFAVYLVNGVSSKKYTMEACNSDVPILSGIGCGLANPISNWLNPMITKEDGTASISANSNGFGLLWNQSQPKFFYFNFTYKEGGNVIDSCRGKVVFVPVADATINDQYLKQNCQPNPGDPTSFGVDTAIGCVPTTSLQDFLTFVLKWAFLVSGGIILLMIIQTGYLVLTSSGNPEKLQAARENIIALFSGLGLIVFSLVLLKAIGAGILGLPGF